MEAVYGPIEIYLDGVRSAAPISSKPWPWAPEPCSSDGGAGVVAVLQMLMDELDGTMGSARTTIDSIDIDTFSKVSPLLAMFPHADKYL